MQKYSSLAAQISGGSEGAEERRCKGADAHMINDTEYKNVTKFLYLPGFISYRDDETEQ